MNWLLLVVIVILAVNIIYGIHKGALRMLYRALSWLFIVIFMMVVTPYMDTFLTNRTGLDEWIQQRVESYANDHWDSLEQQIQDKLTNGGAGSSSTSTGENRVEENSIKAVSNVALSDTGENAASAGEDLSNEVNHLHGDGKIQIPDSLKNTFNQARDSLEKNAAGAQENIQKVEEEAKQNVITQVSTTVTGYVMRGIAALVTFILAKMIVWIIGLFVRAADRTRVIGGISRILGAFLGLGIGFLYVWILLYIIGCFYWTNLGSTLTSMIQQSAFLTLVDGHNLIRTLING